jgi:hypothetical protein
MADQFNLNQLLGGGLPAGLLSPEQEAAAQQRAQAAGLLNFAFGALQASRGAPGQGRPSLGQIIGQAGPVGVAGYQQSFEDTLKRSLQGMQIAEMRRKQEESQQLRSLLPQVFQVTRTPEKREVFATETGDYERVTPGGVSGVRIDPAKLQALMMIPGGAEAVRGLAETQKLVRQAGLGVGGAEMTSPFAPYMSAQSPEVRRLAETYDRGFKTGTIDEETAFKRIESLGRLEDTFVSREQARVDREFTREQSRLDRELAREQGRVERESAREEKRLQGTEGQNLSSGFANRMVASNAITDQLEELQAEGKAQVFPTKTTSTAAGVPFVGGFLQRKTMSPEQQQYKQAADNWIRANLRKESGAAIPPDEMQLEYETYFPVVGDEPAVIEQKKEARRITTEAMIKNAGPVYKPQDVTTLPTIRQIRTKFQLESGR